MGLQGAWWKWGIFALMLYVIYGAFFIAKAQVGFSGSGQTARIMFFHVPVALLSYICYAVAAVYAVQYLKTDRARRSDAHKDAKSAAAMELGFLFCILATITGSIFADVQWGNFWNWDPRETSIVIMLLLYASYLVMRGAVADRPTVRARLSAVYTLVALVPATFLIWVVPRILDSNHPTNVIVSKSGMSNIDRLVFYPSCLAFILLFVWLFQLRYRLYLVAERGTGSRE